MRRVLPILLLVLSFGVRAQGPTPVAKPEDVKSIDSILSALYGVISHPPGTKLDSDRFRSLFTADARMIVASAQGGSSTISSITPEEYIKLYGSYKLGFFEKEIARRTEQFANIAQVFSTFEARLKKDAPRPFERGINAFQLYNDGTRWWILSVCWQGESRSNPLPPKYLPNAG